MGSRRMMMTMGTERAVTMSACMLVILALFASGANAQLPTVALLAGSADPATRGDYMQDAMNGGILGCGGTQDDVERNLVANLPYFNGTLCDLSYFFVNNAAQGGTDEECTQECVVAAAVEAGYDLIVAISFSYGGAIRDAATANPDMNFAIIDNSYSPVIPNVEAFVWQEDQAGFLAGVVAGEVAVELEKFTLGAVGGIPIPPVKKFINGFAVGARDVCPQCPVFEVYSESFGSVEEGEAKADLLLDAGVEIAFCAGGLTGSSACKKLAENDVYVIGVDVDEYYTTFEGGAADASEFLLTSALKSTSRAVTFAIQCFLFNFGDCAGKDNLLDASNRGIELAPCHEACDVYTESTQVKVEDLYQALADEAISTGISPSGDIIEAVVTVLED